MSTSTSCQGTNDDNATTCIYCGQTFKKPGLWRRFLDVFPSKMSEQEEQSFEHLQAGDKLQQQERWEEAIGEFGEAIRIDPEQVAAYVARALT